jgi:hypothetical protein
MSFVYGNNDTMLDKIRWLKDLLPSLHTQHRLWSSIQYCLEISWQKPRLTAGRPPLNLGSPAVTPRFNRGCVGVVRLDRNSHGATRRQHHFAECKFCIIKIRINKIFAILNVFRRLGSNTMGKLSLYSRILIVSILLLNPQLYRAISCMHL